MRRLHYLFLALLVAAAVASYLQKTQAAIPAAPTQPAQSQPSVAIGQPTKTGGCVIINFEQDKACTPGAIITTATKDQICVPGYSKKVRNVPVEEKRQVYAEYGITSHKPNEYEVDHLISLELGGSNDISNLWPEAALPQPGFHEKDMVENYLHAQVCNGSESLEQAQHEIAGDWLTIYKSLPNPSMYK